MDSLKLHIANASGSISADQRKMVRSAFQRAAKISAQNLEIDWGVDFVLVDNASRTIPEEGFCGFTMWDTFVVLYVDPAKTVSEDVVFSTICHEFAHVKRFHDLPKYDARLIAAVVSEGLAVAFEEEVSVQAGFFLAEVQRRVNSEQLLGKMQELFESEDWAHKTLFVDGDEEAGWPRWSGYQVGYFLVKNYMEKTGQKASQIMSEPVEKFIK